MPDSHQKKALTFMLQREQAWTFEGSEGDLWVKEADETGGIMLVMTNITKDGLNHC
jgi:hypothetical protein